MTTENYLKIPLLVVVFGLLTSCSNNNISYSNCNDWNKFGLNGKVKTYLESNYDAEMKLGEWIKGDIQYYGYTKVLYDSKGNLQEKEQLDKNNKLFGKLIQKREKEGVIERTNYDKDGEWTHKTKIIYNSEEEVEVITYDDDGEKISQGKAYFTNCRITRGQGQKFENNNVKEEYTVVYEYDKDGNLISQKETDKEGETIYLFKYKYLVFDENNNWTKRLLIDSTEGEEYYTIVIREYEYY